MRAACPVGSCVFLIGTVLLGAGAGGAGASDRSLQLAMRGAGEYSSECAPEMGRGKRAAQGELVRARVRVAGAARVHGLRIVTDRCARDTRRVDAPPTSSWVRHGSRRIDPRRRYRLDTRRGGEYRVRAVGRSRGGELLRSDPVYLRVEYPTTVSAKIEWSNPGVGLTYGGPILAYPHFGGTSISGQVASPDPNCVVGRNVYVYRVRGPNWQYAHHGWSDDNGYYSITISRLRMAKDAEYVVFASERGACATGRSRVVSGR